VVYLPREKRFAAMVNRFDWADALTDDTRPGADAPFARRRAALRFERVLSAKVQNIDLRSKSSVLCLLAIGFEPREAPAGDLVLMFANKGAIRLHVECIEAELKDLGPVWQAKSRPRHPDDPAEA
jgi:hypothetical protein